MTDTVSGEGHTKGLPSVERCSRCGAYTNIDALDGKPRLSLWLWLVRAFIGQERMLSYAASKGYDFDDLECQTCYGAGYEARP